MDFELTPEQQAIRSAAREFAEAELGDRIAPYDERHEFARDIVAKLGPLGFLGALVPEEYGGAGLDYVSYALIVEELNRGDASVGITMWAHNSLCTNPMPRSPTRFAAGTRASSKMSSAVSEAWSPSFR